MMHCRVFPLPPNSIYPYDSGAAAAAGITSNAPCVNPENPACAAYPGSSSGASQYFLIPPAVSINKCALSESQLVQVGTPFSTSRLDLQHASARR